MTDFLCKNCGLAHDDLNHQPDGVNEVCPFEPLLRLDVLDHGFVELIDVMGDDVEPARAARISYADGKARSPEAEMGLQKYLLRNHHTTPFEMVELKFRVKLPIFVARQWVRHRTANINEFSMRYADPERLSDDGSLHYYVPDTWRIKDPTNKQGSIVPSKGHPLHPTTDVSKDLRRDFANHQEDCISEYRTLQEVGIANEIARGALTVFFYTEWIWKNDLHNTLHFLNLRADGHAQWEIQEYARAMIMLLTEKLPGLMELWSSEQAKLPALLKAATELLTFLEGEFMPMSKLIEGREALREALERYK